MGLFRSKKRTTVTATNSRMMEDDAFQYSIKTAVLQHVWDSSGKFGLDKPNMSDYLIDGINQSLPRTYQRAYRTASNPSKYWWGLPKAQVVTRPQERLIQAMEDYINEQDTNPEIVDIFIDDKNLYMETWHKLITVYGYNLESNILDTLSTNLNKTCYLQDAYIELKQTTRDLLEEENLKPRTISFNYNQIEDIRDKDILREFTPIVIGSSDRVVVSYTWFEPPPQPDPNNPPDPNTLQPQGQWLTDYFEFDLSYLNPEVDNGDDIAPEDDTIYATYISEDGVVHFLKHTYGSLDIPQLAQSLTNYADVGEYYPRLHIRQDAKDVQDINNPTMVKSAKRMYKRMGMDLKGTTEMMHKSVGNEYGNVRNLFIQVAVPINKIKGDKHCCEYLYRYFERLHNLSERYPVTITKTKKERINGELVEVAYEEEDNSIERHHGLVQDIQDKSTVVSIAYNYTIKETIQSSNLTVGEYDIEYGEIVVDEGKRYRGISKWFRKNRPRITLSIHTLVYQVDEDTCIKYHVYGLSNHVSASGYRQRLDGENLAIPLDKSLVKHLNQKEREVLFHKSMHITLLHVKVTKVKWYQRGIFKVLVVVVAIALSVAFSPAGAGFAVVMKAVFMGIVKGLAISLAAQALLKIAIKFGLDPKYAAVLEVVINIVAMAYGAGWDFSKLLTAPNIMKVVNLSFQAYTKHLEFKMGELKNDWLNLQNLMANQQQKISQVQKMLDTRMIPMDMEMLTSSFTPTVNPYMTPELFYSMKDAYNVIEASYGLISNFVVGTLASYNQPHVYTPPTEFDMDSVLYV